MDRKIIPFKNYLIFAIVSVTSFILVFYLANWYKEIRTEMNNSPIVGSVLSKVLIDELDNYIIENSSFVLYCSSSNDTSIASFEKSFKKLIINNEIQRHIVYLDTSVITSESRLKEVASKYLTSNINSDGLLVNPNLIIFKDRKITDVLYTNSTKINIEIVKQFLIDNEVIE